MKMFYRVVMVLAVVWLAGCSSTGGTKGGVAVEDLRGPARKAPPAARRRQAWAPMAT